MNKMFLGFFVTSALVYLGVIFCIAPSADRNDNNDGAVKSGEKEAEQFIEESTDQKFLQKLYHTKLGTAERKILTKKIVSKNVGTFFADRMPSKFYIKKFLKAHPTILEHADEFEAPVGGLTAYPTFNQFFYRKLSAKGLAARPINRDPRVVTSMADCHLFVIQDLSKNPDFFVKGCKFNVERFVDDAELAQRYHNGSLLLFRLAPEDYHRFHFPFDCKPGLPKKIAGRYESVNPLAYTPTVVPQFDDSGKELYTPRVNPLLTNERQVIILKSPEFGDVICVVVGALMVGKIFLTYLDSMKTQTIFTKGQEMGYFAFGASSIVLIFESGKISIEKELLDRSNQDNVLSYYKTVNSRNGHQQVNFPESVVKMGQAIAKAAR